MGQGVDEREAVRNGFPPVGVIVVNWNNYDDTVACLESLADVPYPNFTVYVVDNGSTDGSGPRLERYIRQVEWCEFVANQENLGFGGGVNTGIERAMVDEVEYVLLLNNDARIPSRDLEELVGVSEESGAGVVGGRIVDEDGSSINPTPCYFPDMLFYSGYRDRLSFIPDRGSPDGKWWATERVEGAAMLMSRRLLEDRMASVGYYFDESLFMYCEEVELAMWCRGRGEVQVIADRTSVRHEGGAGSARSFQLYYLTRNRLLLAHREFGIGKQLVFDISYIGTRLVRASRYLAQGQGSVSQSIVRGLIDGFRGINGPGACNTGK